MAFLLKSVDVTDCLNLFTIVNYPCTPRENFSYCYMMKLARFHLEFLYLKLGLFLKKLPLPSIDITLASEKHI